ncbi:mitochondrial import inner membrane translocase subunit Tim10 isoform X1 [Betta splendens]|uniref:Mitochondrial import inner membrane translocase subunit Tim10 isoform X1 n=1 Tax=Betta splendens TaxID=158456 RepID=A0A9W2Y8Z7_BETSP|nr:mitochondrial import inner membrane translocase subunit Tim10 isoform X1 [Betta splendens]
MKKGSVCDAQPAPLVPVACRASTVNNSPLIKRKRGRPPKVKVVDLPPTSNNAALVHEKNNSGQNHNSPVFLSNVSQEMASLRDQEQPLKNQDEVKSCDAAGSSAILAELVDAGGQSRTTGSDKEEEEVEVDVLLSSPHRTPPVTALTMVIPPDEEEEEEEEEEEMIEIDVTGDELE